jgi:hypothetical protein
MTSDEKDRAPPGHKARMAVPPDAPPGIEQDGRGNLIPFPQRTPEDQERARQGR